MKKQNKNLMKGLILIAAFLSPMGLQAQTFLGTPWTQSSPAVTTGTDTNGTFLSTAPFNSSLTFNSTETATTNPQFLWVPALGALRVGVFSSAPSTTTMGQLSIAIGANSTASGALSTAMCTSLASGTAATAIGMYTSATNYAAIAMGGLTIASGNTSTAIGYSTVAGGDNSTATGSETSANSYDSFTIGTYNLGYSSTGATPSLTSWVATDPLLEVGNGTFTAPSDAFVVYKNGSATFQGQVTIAPGGDIPMFTGY